MCYNSIDMYVDLSPDKETTDLILSMVKERFKSKPDEVIVRMPDNISEVIRQATSQVFSEDDLFNLLKY